jgi:hypothetical protein
VRNKTQKVRKAIEKLGEIKPAENSRRMGENTGIVCITTYTV